MQAFILWGLCIGILDIQDQQNGVLHKLYFGPKIRSDLMSVAPDLELSIDMGWFFWFLAQPLVMLLVAINSFIGNWGFSIIILTVLLKLLLWPISQQVTDLWLK